MGRIHAEEVKNKKNKDVVLKGWVNTVRNLGKVIFLVLRDSSGVVQLVSVKGEEMFDKIKNLRREDVIQVEGKAVESDKAPNGVEVQIKNFEVLNKAEALPIEFSGKIETDLSKRLDYRYLDLRNKKNKMIFELKSAIANAARDFFVKNKFVEIHTPKIVGEGAEGGSELFPILYYEKEGYLAQSPQFYKQLLQGCCFEKVFEIGPYFRAEKSHTSRHISEFWMLDGEISFIENYEDITKLVEDLVCYILDDVKKNCKYIFDCFEVEPPKYKKPVPRITLKEAFEMIGKEGDDLSTDDEKALGEKIKEKYDSDLIFVTKYPFEVRPFYTMKDKDNPKLTESFDFILKGLELVTGSQREHRYDALVKQAEEKGMNPNSMKFYMEAFKHGMPPHGGFGLGLERFVMQLLNLGNVREAVLFPRDVERMSP